MQKFLVLLEFMVYFLAIVGTTWNKTSLHPSLHNNTVHQPSALNTHSIIIKSAIWECGTNCVRTSEIFRARSSRKTTFSLKKY